MDNIDPNTIAVVILIISSIFIRSLKNFIKDFIKKF
jgi:hypothetical protein